MGPSTSSQREDTALPVITPIQSPLYFPRLLNTPLCLPLLDNLPAPFYHYSTHLFCLPHLVSILSPSSHLSNSSLKSAFAFTFLLLASTSSYKISLYLPVAPDAPSRRTIYIHTMMSPMLWFYGIAERLRLEGTSRDYVIQPSCSSRAT